MTRDQFLARLAELYDANLAIAKTKNADYADDDPFKNFRQCEHLGLAPVGVGIAVRMSDKLARISNLLSRPAEVADESVGDTLSDLANYAMILRVWLEQPR